MVVRARSSSPSSAASSGDERGQVAADERLPAGEPDRTHPHRDEDAHDPLDLLEGEELGPLEPAQSLGRHAVPAAEVAPVGDGQAKVADPAAVPVDEGIEGDPLRLPPTAASGTPGRRDRHGRRTITATAAIANPI